MPKEFVKDKINVAQLRNDGPDNADDNLGIKLKQTIRCTCGAVSTRILHET